MVRDALLHIIKAQAQQAPVQAHIDHRGRIAALRTCSRSALPARQTTSRPHDDQVFAHPAASWLRSVHRATARRHHAKHTSRPDAIDPANTESAPAAPRRPASAAVAAPLVTGKRPAVYTLAIFRLLQNRNVQCVLIDRWLGLGAYPAHIHFYKQGADHRFRRSAAFRRVCNRCLQSCRVDGFLYDPRACDARWHAESLSLVCKERVEMGAFPGLGIMGYRHAVG